MYELNTHTHTHKEFSEKKGEPKRKNETNEREVKMFETFRHQIQHNDNDGNAILSLLLLAACCCCPSLVLPFERTLMVQCYCVARDSKPGTKTERARAREKKHRHIACEKYRKKRKQFLLAEMDVHVL